MRILVLNGSPRGKRSDTMILTNTFVEGLRKDGDLVDTINIADYDVRGCRGCFGCWANGGICVIKDDAPRLQEDYFFKADIVIWSFPLYFFAMPSQIKAFMDRLFVDDYPDMVLTADGFPTHPTRHDVSKMRHIVISTCGFYTAEGLYDAVMAHFKTLFKEKFAGAITCGQGSLFSKETLPQGAGQRLETIKELGCVVASGGCINEEKQAELAKPLISKEI
ncbi:MAG: flavodoxin family protein, partial [Cloacibacillus sp.]